jgi:hypothetical protein
MANIRERLRSAARIGKDSARTKERVKVEHIWKQGFPSGTDEDVAVQEATANAASQGITGTVINSEIIQTPEHEANNEFLVCLTFGRVRDIKDSKG